MEIGKISPNLSREETLHSAHKDGSEQIRIGYTIFI